MKKRRQHYVWKHYLQAWATNDQVWCLRDGKRFPANPENIAVQRDFYRLKEMTPADLRWIDKVVISQMRSPAREIAQDWIPHFTEPFKIKRDYEASGQKDAHLEELLDTAINNIEEDLHALVESEAVPALAALRNDPRVLLRDEELFGHFSYFVAMQYVRTPGLQQTINKTFEDAPGFNIDASWGFLRTVLATSMGLELNRRQGSLRIIVLKAAPGTEFITGDQPLLNTRADGKDPSKVPTELELYYPVSPSRAVLLDFAHNEPGVVEQELTAEEMQHYKQLMVAASHEQLYGATEDALS